MKHQLVQYYQYYQERKWRTPILHPVSLGGWLAPQSPSSASTLSWTPLLKRSIQSNPSSYTRSLTCYFFLCQQDHPCTTTEPPFKRSKTATQTIKRIIEEFPKYWTRMKCCRQQCKCSASCCLLCCQCRGCCFPTTGHSCSTQMNLEPGASSKLLVVQLAPDPTTLFLIICFPCDHTRHHALPITTRCCSTMMRPTPTNPPT